MYKRQGNQFARRDRFGKEGVVVDEIAILFDIQAEELTEICLLYTSDAADERSSVDLGGRRIIKKTKPVVYIGAHIT